MSDADKYLHWGRVSSSILARQGGTGQQSDVPMTGDMIENYLASRSPTTPRGSLSSLGAGGWTPTQILPGNATMYGFSDPETKTPSTVTELWLRNMMQRLSDLGQ